MRVGGGAERIHASRGGRGSLKGITVSQTPDPQGACTMKTTTAAAARPILALDLGKYKSVACAYDRTTAQAAFDSIPTSKAELLRLLDRHQPALVVTEA